MNPFKILFGNSETTDKLVDGAVRGIDALVYTDEEKAEARQKGLDWFIEYQKATLPQNVSRRYIAIIVVALWALLVLFIVVARSIENMVGASTSTSDFVYDVLKEIVAQPYNIVIGFYFLTQTVRALRSDK